MNLSVNFLIGSFLSFRHLLFVDNYMKVTYQSTEFGIKLPNKETYETKWMNGGTRLN